MTYPKTEIRPATITDEPVTSADIIAVKNTDTVTASDDQEALPLLLRATPETHKSKSFQTTYLRYRNSIVIIGLFVGLAAMLVGYIMYAVRRRRKTTNEEPTAADVAVVMNDLYNDKC